MSINIIRNTSVVELTKKLLKEYKEPQLVKQGFETIVNDTRESVLILGLNPAGGEEDAEREKDGNLYLNYIPINSKIYEKCPNIKKLSNSVFDSQIYTAMTDIFGDSFVWDWCNKLDIINDYDKILKEKNGNGFTDDEKLVISDFVEKRKNAKYQIHIGEMFYYHQTSNFANEIKYDWDRKRSDDVDAFFDNILKMVDEHIDSLKSVGKTPKFIYINSACASHYFDTAIRRNDLVVMEDFGGYIYRDIPIVLGAPLSGLGRVDSFSYVRLISQLKKFI